MHSLQSMGNLYAPSDGLSWLYPYSFGLLLKISTRHERHSDIAKVNWVSDIGVVDPEQVLALKLLQ
jgi:hypothetical protein